MEVYGNMLLYYELSWKTSKETLAKPSYAEGSSLTYKKGVYIHQKVIMVYFLTIPICYIDNYYNLLYPTLLTL